MLRSPASWEQREELAWAALHLASTPIFASELILSALRRAATLAGGTALDVFVHVVSGVDSHNPGEEVFGLENVCENLPHLPSPERLIREHSRYDLFASCAAPVPKEMYRLHLLKGRRGPARPSRLYEGGQIPSAVELHCPACDLDAMSNKGAVFGLRFHLYPYMNVCPLHRESLYIPPWCGRTDTGLEASRANDDDMRLASLIKLCIETRHEHSPLQKHELLTRLRAAGFVSNAGRVAITDLQNNFRHYYEGRFTSAYMQRLVADESYLHWSIRALLHPDKSLSPIVACLLHWFAGEVRRTRPPSPPLSFLARVDKRRHRENPAVEKASSSQGGDFHLSNPTVLARRLKRLGHRRKEDVVNNLQ